MPYNNGMPRPKTPALTVDIIIEMHDQPNRPVVLIERKYPPHGWAIPGGFVDVGEMVSNAAVREALEETCLEVTLDVLLGCYSDPARDDRLFEFNPVVALWQYFLAYLIQFSSGSTAFLKRLDRISTGNDTNAGEHLRTNYYSACRQV